MDITLIKKILFSVLLIVALGVGVYANSMKGDFLWDDFHLVKRNEYIKSWTNLPKMFASHIGEGSGRRYHLYRPVQTITYTVDHSVWGLDQFGYHFSNVIFHILAALCVYWLAFILLKDAVAALITGIIFTVHPLFVEAVAYIAGRMDSVSTVFMLLSFIFYIKDVEKGRGYLKVISVAAFILAVLSKEVSIILPAAIYLYHIAFGKEIRRSSFALISGVSMLYLLARFTVLKDLLTHVVDDTTFVQRLPGFFLALSEYAKLIIAPVGLHMEYGEKIFPWNEPGVLIGLIIFSSLIYVSILKRKDDPFFSFAIMWFLVFLMPYSNLYPINAYMAEHWLYVPLVGGFMLFARALRGLMRKERTRVFGISAAAVLVLFYSVLAARQSYYWSEPFTFYNYMIRYVKDSEVMYNNLGVLYGAKGEYGKAIPLFKRSIALRYYYIDPYFNLGKVYNAIGRKEEAIEMYERGLRFTRGTPDPAILATLGGLYAETGKKDMAVKAYKAASAIAPEDKGVAEKLTRLETAAE